MRYTYSKGTSSLYFLAPDGREYELGLEFLVRHWYEARPYGSTSASEPLSDVVEDSERYELDGEPAELDDLRERFGKDLINPLLTRLEQAATYTNHKVDHDYDPD